jgi:hypothetical protein
VVLVRDGKPLALLELKRTGVELTDSDRAQGLSYADQMRPKPPLLVITNGATTQLYRTFDGSEWKPSSNIEQAIDSLFASVGRIAASQVQGAIETLLGVDSTVVRKVVNTISAATIAELTGDWGDKYRPFARGLLFPRKATNWVADEIARGRGVVIVTGPPLSGKSNVLRELYDKYQAAADTVFLFIEGASSRHGLFQLIADVLCRELSWNLTADQARQWLASVATNAAFDLIIAVDDCDPDVMAAELDSIASSAFGPHVRVVLTCDPGVVPLLTQSRNQRQSTRLGRLAAITELLPMDDDEFEDARKLLYAARIGFMHGAQLACEYRAPWVLRTIAAGISVAPKYQDTTKASAAPSLPGFALLKYAEQRFSEDETLQAHYGAFADAMLDELLTSDVSVNLARALTFVCSRATLLKHISEEELSTGVLRGVFKSTLLAAGQRAVVAQIPELVALMIARRLGAQLAAHMRTDPEGAARALTVACELVPLGDVIGASAIFRASRIADGMSTDVIVALLRSDPVRAVLAPGEWVGRSNPGDAGAQIEITAGGASMVVGVDDDYASRELGSEGVCQTLTYNLMPWLILSYVSLQIDDDELLPWLLGTLARCDVALLPFRAYARCAIHKLQGFEEFVCHEHGLAEPLAISLMEATLASREIGEHLVSEAIKHESAPMLARLMVAFRAIVDLEDPQRRQWAQGVLTQRIEPVFERVTR